MDAIIVLDASGSVGFTNWQKSVQFASDLGHSIMGFHPGNKVGVVEFSQVANEAIDFTDSIAIFDNGINVLNGTYQVKIFSMNLHHFMTEKGNPSKLNY